MRVYIITACNGSKSFFESSKKEVREWLSIWFEEASVDDPFEITKKEMSKSEYEALRKLRGYEAIRSRFVMHLKP